MTTQLTKNLSAKGLKIGLARQANSMGTKAEISHIDENDKTVSVTAKATKLYPNPATVLEAYAIVSGWTIKK